MYPFGRLAWHRWQARRAPLLGPFDLHHITTRIMPWDIDPFGELNNGRTLTLYDLGRLALFDRMGLEARITAQGWRPTIAGISVRYRRRITVFDTLQMASRVIGWDARFFYMDQSLWRAGDCCNQILARTAFTTGVGIVPTDKVAQTAGWQGTSPPLPDWVQAWSQAEAQRPWPPETGAPIDAPPQPHRSP
jgi:acyl-CoA thioesterase FadM